MNIKEIYSAIFLILISLTDFYLYRTLSISDICLIFLAIIVIYKRPQKIYQQSLIFTGIAIFGLFIGMVSNNAIQYRSFFASLAICWIVGLFSKINLKIYEKINFGRVINLVLTTISFFTLIDLIYIYLFKSSLNISGLYGNEARAFTGYYTTGSEIIRPCGLYPEPGDNTSIIAIFISLKIYLTQKFNLKYFSKGNIPILLGMISIMSSQSTLGTLTLILIILYFIWEKTRKSIFLLNLIKKFKIKIIRIKKKDLALTIIFLFIIIFAIFFTLPRIASKLAASGSIDITRTLILIYIFDLSRGVIPVLLGTSFEVPNFLINSMSQFINLFYQFGIFSFILFYVFLKPALLDKRRFLFLFIFIVFLSKLNISSIPFWLALYFCQNEMQNKNLLFDKS
tara:strand:- start:221 stop:1411 length:1191 start_codon:yes stop_codon:yes gene_type:complete